jgi:putative membrane protein
MKLKQLLSIVSLGIGIIGASAVAAEADAAKGAGKLAPADQKFVMKAAQGGMAEVKLGEVAKEKGKSDDVKKFGEQMVTDHTKANEELKTVASQKGIALPEKLDASHASAIEKMSKLEGDQFDKAYIADMLKDHKEDVAEFEAASKNVKDPEIKGFAAKTLPTLKQHLEHVQQLKGTKAK